MRNAAFTWKLLLTGLTIALAGLPLTLRGQTKGETDQQAVVAVIDWFVDAWNRFQATAPSQRSVRAGDPARMHQPSVILKEKRKVEKEEPLNCMCANSKLSQPKGSPHSGVP